MPKSRKRPQKPSVRSSQRRQPVVYVPDPSINFSKAEPIDDTGAVPSAEDWQRLHDSFLAEYPACPDCGAAWDLTLAIEEMGQLGDGTFEISLAISCPTYGADEVAGRRPSTHRRASDGMPDPPDGPIRTSPVRRQADRSLPRSRLRRGRRIGSE